jgi:hypothetical protein
MKMQPPPVTAHVPRHHPSGPLGMLRTPPWQSLLDVFRKHRHRIAQHRHVHPPLLTSPKATAQPTLRKPQLGKTPTTGRHLHTQQVPQRRQPITLPTRSSKNTRTQSVE